MSHYRAIALEPDALEPMLRDAFTYTVGPDETKLLLASWQTRNGSGGRFEQRNPEHYVPMRGMTLQGTGAGSTAMILDPAFATYTDPSAIHAAREAMIHELPTKHLWMAGANKAAPLLCGAYGAIITQVTCFNLAWVITRWCGTYGLNLANEISDTVPQRVGNALRLPISKRHAGVALTSSASTTANGSPFGSVSFVLLPKDWPGREPDPAAYAFRDDFMGDALDTSVWTRQQSAVGNVEIDPTYQWLRFTGNGWGNNGLFRTEATTRTAGRSTTVDVYAPVAQGSCIVGWSDGQGHSYSNMAHGLNFANNGVLNVYENGVARGQVGTYTGEGVYRVRVELTDAGAIYRIQGGKQYPAIGSELWADVTPAGSASATTELHEGAAAFGGTAYLSDFRTLG